MFICLFVCRLAGQGKAWHGRKSVTHRIPLPRQTIIVQRIRMQVLSIDLDERRAVQIDGQRRASSLLLLLVQDLFNVLGTVACNVTQRHTTN